MRTGHRLTPTGRADRCDMKIHGRFANHAAALFACAVELMSGISLEIKAFRI
jgi:hypothetical protein